MTEDEQGPRATMKGIAKGWASRTWATTRAAASLGRMAARKVVDSAFDLGTADEGESDDANTEALVERLDEMKGLMLKVGQMLSTLDGAIPEAAQKRLARLHSQAKPLDWPAIEDVLRTAYGAPPTDVFDQIETEPFAAASIGQVHRAKIGEHSVAVKVQYPGVASTFETDLRNFRALFRIGTLGTALDSQALIDEMRDRLSDECNYQQEAAFQNLFRSIFADDARVRIPKVHDDLCHRHVLVSELALGKTFAHFRDTASQSERNAAGTLLFEFAFRAIFERCVFNGDPHPGNYLFNADGSVVFLDFGCVRVFDAAFIDNWKGIARAMLQEDKDAFSLTYAAGGFVGGRGYDFDAQYEVIRYLYEPMLAKSFQYSHDYVKRSWKVLVMNSNFRKTALPPEWLLIQRLQWGLNSLLADLGAEGDFRSIFARYVDGPTRPAPRPPAIGSRPL